MVSALREKCCLLPKDFPYPELLVEDTSHLLKTDQVARQTLLQWMKEHPRWMKKNKELCGHFFDLLFPARNKQSSFSYSPIVTPEINDHHFLDNEPLSLSFIGEDSQVSSSTDKNSPSASEDTPQIGDDEDSSPYERLLPPESSDDKEALLFGETFSLFLKKLAFSQLNWTERYFKSKNKTAQHSTPSYNVLRLSIKTQWVAFSQLLLELLPRPLTQELLASPQGQVREPFRLYFDGLKNFLLEQKVSPEAAHDTVNESTLWILSDPNCEPLLEHCLSHYPKSTLGLLEKEDEHFILRLLEIGRDKALKMLYKSHRDLTQKLLLAAIKTDVSKLQKQLLDLPLNSLDFLLSTCHSEILSLIGAKKGFYCPFFERALLNFDSERLKIMIKYLREAMEKALFSADTQGNNWLHKAILKNALPFFKLIQELFPKEMPKLAQHANRDTPSLTPYQLSLMITNDCARRLRELEDAHYPGSSLKWSAYL